MNHDNCSVFGWRISSHSPDGGKSCVEVGWHVSSHSPSGGGSCVEAGPLLDGSTRFAVRDSTQPDLGFLSFGRTEWAAFVSVAKHDTL